MSDAAEGIKKGGLFDYTQRAYWGGPWYTYWTLMVLTIFGGLLGLDHLYLRSPLTALAKFVFNILTLGLWYVYDMIQIIGEPESVQKNGLSIPIYGASGIGSGMFVDDQPGVATSRSPLRWLAYMALVFLPFGFDLFVAGDTNGALAKFLCSILFFLWPIAFIWGAYSVGTAYLTPKKVWEEGAPRMFPFTFFMDGYGRSVLGPVDVPQSKDNCDPGGKNGILNTILNIVKSSVGIFFPGILPAVAATSAAVEAGATTAKVGMNTASGLIRKSGDVVGSALNSIADPSKVAAVSGIASGVGAQLSSYQDPAVLRAAAGLQQGGGEGSELSHLALLTFFLFVLGSGSYMAASRLNISIPFFSRPERNGSQRNDAPPKP